MNNPLGELFDVSGKIALVTGGSRGIGAMIARGLVAAGVKTYISARTATQPAGLENCIAISADLATQAGIDTLAQELSHRENRLHILVNNAGTIANKHFDVLSEADWHQEMNLNTRAPFFLIQQLKTLLKNGAAPQDPARIINIASIMGMPEYGSLKGFPSTYMTSKAALIQMTRTLAMELADEHITVNSLSPGMFPTDMNAPVRQGRETAVAQDVPLGRIGTPEDIIGAVIYLSSRAGAWLTGVNIPVDGGKVSKRF